jgi:hypothetical protein
MSYCAADPKQWSLIMCLCQKCSSVRWSKQERYSYPEGQWPNSKTPSEALSLVFYLQKGTKFCQPGPMNHCKSQCHFASWPFPLRSFPVRFRILREDLRLVCLHSLLVISDLTNCALRFIWLLSPTSSDKDSSPKSWDDDEIRPLLRLLCVKSDGPIHSLHQNNFPNDARHHSNRSFPLI